MPKTIPLSRGKFALVSDCDYERASQFKWSLDVNGYACRMESYVGSDGKRKRRKVLLHRFILDAPPHLQVDHIDHDKLDNRRQSLRLVTRTQNRANSRPRRNSSSRYKGVHWHKRDQCWCVMLRTNGVKYWIGTFQDEVDAARAYDRKARELIGAYAYLNFEN